MMGLSSSASVDEPIRKITGSVRVPLFMAIKGGVKGYTIMKCYNITLFSAAQSSRARELKFDWKLLVSNDSSFCATAKPGGDTA